MVLFFQFLEFEKLSCKFDLTKIACFGSPMTAEHPHHSQRVHQSILMSLGNWIQNVQNKRAQRLNL